MSINNDYQNISFNQKNTDIKTENSEPLYQNIRSIKNTKQNDTDFLKTSSNILKESKKNVNHPISLTQNSFKDIENSNNIDNIDEYKDDDSIHTSLTDIKSSQIKEQLTTIIFNQLKYKLGHESNSKKISKILVDSFFKKNLTKIKINKNINNIISQCVKEIAQQGNNPNFSKVTKTINKYAKKYQSLEKATHKLSDGIIYNDKKTRKLLFKNTIDSLNKKHKNNDFFIANSDQKINKNELINFFKYNNKLLDGKSNSYIPSKIKKSKEFKQLKSDYKEVKEFNKKFNDKSFHNENGLDKQKIKTYFKNHECLYNPVFNTSLPKDIKENGLHINRQLIIKETYTNLFNLINNNKNLKKFNINFPNPQPKKDSNNPDFFSLTNNNIETYSKEELTHMKKDFKYINILPSKSNLASDENNFFNASFIPIQSNPHYYIAAQGPEQNNINNNMNQFVHMLKKQNSNISISLVNKDEIDQKDGSRVNDKAMWKNQSLMLNKNIGDTQNYDGINVKLTNRLDLSDKIRVDTIEIDGKEHQRIYYYGWEDHTSGNPADIIALSMLKNKLESMNEEQNNSEKNNSLIVNCNAGVGRTGTFIMIDKMVKDYLENNDITTDLYQTISKARTARTSFVQNEGQYNVLATLRNDSDFPKIISSLKDEIGI